MLRRIYKWAELDIFFEESYDLIVDSSYAVLSALSRLVKFAFGQDKPTSNRPLVTKELVSYLKWRGAGRKIRS